MGRIGRIRTDFYLFFCLKFGHWGSKKSVRIRPIRPIRSPIVSAFSKAEIAVLNKFNIFFSIGHIKS
jgi:hypothetical protein